MIISDLECLDFSKKWLKMNQSVLNDPQGAHPEAYKRYGLMSSQNEKKMGDAALDGLYKRKLQNKEHSDAVNKGEPHGELIKHFDGHEECIGIERWN